MKRNKNRFAVGTLLLLSLLLAACGGNNAEGNSEAKESGASAADSEVVPTGSEQKVPASEQSENEETKPPEGAQEEAQILVIIDQTEKPIEGNSFDFSIKQLPEGYSLREMRWESGENRTVSTLEEAIEKGRTGGDGFYISGNGQFSGFFYPDSMKGEEGEVSFLFSNEAGEQKTWSKKITLH
ncbi:hypothetical protein [Saccharibacillus alkalitolerans]|uniref:DUF4352 domain-containing protein n=1 Tax=Saccharibacillus alkalitolerans TaxID=2705290 RepID=A0ABX0F0U1_9BACL|nr:hypothetical protein [Saccharibacillus alkalitolerans]NGZ74603.1 hypothetical protein [Saccharibacillus alkalitolerans]